MFKYTLVKYNNQGAYRLERNGYSLRCHFNSGLTACSSYCPHFNINTNKYLNIIVEISCTQNIKEFKIENPEILKGETK